MENYFQAEAFNLDKVLDEFEQNEGERLHQRPDGCGRGICVTERTTWGNSRANHQGVNKLTEAEPPSQVVIEGMRSGNNTNYIISFSWAFLKLCYWFKVFLFLHA